MINGRSLVCTVRSCDVCQGSGMIPRAAATVALQGTPLVISYGGFSERVPCSQCTNGFVFGAIDEVDLLRHLIRTLASDQQHTAPGDILKQSALAQLRQELRKVLVQATEEQVVGVS